MPFRVGFEAEALRKRARSFVRTLDGVPSFVCSEEVAPTFPVGIKPFWIARYVVGSLVDPPAVIPLSAGLDTKALREVARPFV